jgi:hypothetical protein
VILTILAASAALAATAPATAPAHPVSVAAAQACVLTVVLQCEVKSADQPGVCKVVSEDPNTLGAGEAALAMSAGFHLKPSANGEPVLIPVRIRTGQCGAGE